MQVLLVIRAGWWETYSSGSSHKSWGARGVNKLLPESCWQLAFSVGPSERMCPLLGSRKELSQYHGNYNPDPQGALVKYAIKPFPEKDWEVGTFIRSLCSKPWRDSQLPVLAPKNWFFVCYSLMGLISASPVGFQSCVIGGLSFCSSSLKSWSARYVIQTLRALGRGWKLDVFSPLLYMLRQ